MESIHRVVTHTGPSGTSSVASDGAPAISVGEAGAGPRLSVLWEAVTPVTYENMGGDPAEMTPIVAPGRARFVRLVLGGHATSQDALDIPMHRTDTLDLIYIASGGVDLVLDTETVHLDPDDHLVLQGDVHGWRVTTPEDCVIIAVMLGAPARA
jgi:hypothetical protein